MHKINLIEYVSTKSCRNSFLMLFCFMPVRHLVTLLWLVHTNERAIDGTNRASIDVRAALHAANLVATRRGDAIDCVCEANDALGAKSKIGETS